MRKGKEKRLDGFIGDIIKDGLGVDYLPPVMESSLIEKARREAEIYLKKIRKMEVLK